MKLRINEKDTLMKYKTYGNIEKCFNILVNEKGYSKEEAQNIIDNILADYKYNPNSNDSLLRRINLVLSKDEYEKEYGIAERYTRLKEKETSNIEVKHEGILEVPEGKNVDDLPLSHFVNLANKKGLSKITKALNNLQVWNKNDDPKLSKWAGDMIDKLNKKLKKDESLGIKESSDKKSYWKYSLFDRAIERMKNSDDYYFDERSIKQVKLYPCETEDECYEGDFWPVRKSDYPYTVIFDTKDEAYKELMYYLNNSEYERRYDL